MGCCLCMLILSKRGFPKEKFFFRLDDAYMLLSSIIFGDEECARSKEVYGI